MPKPPRTLRAPSRWTVWLDQRTGYSTLVKLITQEPVSGGPRWWYVFGVVLAFLLALEAVTGVFLAAFYVPSAEGAWASTAAIQDRLTLGWFVRGLHAFGSSALIAVAALHTFQVILFGAYRAPREMTWLTGLGAVGALAAFAMTGHGLPWDEAGYAGKRTELELIAMVPLIGRGLASLLRGGEAMGTPTVTRLYAVHTYALPALTVACAVLHTLLVRRHGITPRWGQDEVKLARATRPYFPEQAARDALACGTVFAAVLLLAIATHGADLGAPADPENGYAARPLWFALPLHQLRSFFQGPLEGLVVASALVLGGALLAVLPWIDRARDRAPGRRKLVLIGAAVGVVALGTAGTLPVLRDRADAAFARARDEAASRATLTRVLAHEKGVPVEGGLAVYRNDPRFRGRELWKQRCARCHVIDASPPPAAGRDPRGPHLRGYGSRPWIAGFLHQPGNIWYMGGAKIERGMKPVVGSELEVTALTEMVYAETGAHDVDAALAERGRVLASKKDCDSCHDFDGTTGNTGPNLKGWGTLAWIVDVIGDSRDERLYGEKGKMPRFADDLSPDEIADLARFVLEESRRP